MGRLDCICLLKLLALLPLPELIGEENLDNCNDLSPPQKQPPAMGGCLILEVGN